MFHALLYVYCCGVVISKAMTDLTRPLTVRFETRHYARLGHEEILESLEENLESSEIKAIQLTETTCLVTVSTREAKETLLSTGLSVRNMYNSLYDVDQVITNVTIKDAPFELSDSFIMYHMKQYGDVIENSLKRGKIKGTDIETGTRYIQMVNVRDVLPNVVELGRFKVRLYSDNKTECRICKDTGHPFFRCPQRASLPPRICGRCKSSDHRTKECTNDIVCNFCDGSGHMQKDCEDYKLSQARQTYGRYAEEILEARKYRIEDDNKVMNETSTSLNPEDKVPEDSVRKTLEFNETHTNDTHDENQNTAEKSNIETEQSNIQVSENTKQDNTVQNRIPIKNLQRTPNKVVNFVLGDSNGVRINVKDPDVKNISKTGQKAAEIGTLLKIAETKASGRSVQNILIHLGTNDVSRRRDDSAQAMVDITTAIKETHKQFPEASIAFSSILPRRGKTTAIKTLNETSKAVNEYVRKMSVKESYLSYLNNDNDMVDNGVPIKAFYDPSDATGVHLSAKGADVLADSFQDFFNCGHISDDEFTTPHAQKRNRSVLSNTPPSDKQIAKTNKVTK